MGLSLNRVVKPQSDLLNKSATVFSDEKSVTKRLYVEGKKPQLTTSDFKYMIRNIKKIFRLPTSLTNTTKLIKSDRHNDKRKMSDNDYKQLHELLMSLDVEEYGFFEVTPERIFKGYGVPHKFALVLSIPMNLDNFKSAPSIECQLEVARVYSSTGNAANRVADFLQSKGYGASPNHSMGGQLDYSMACEWAGIGSVGRHSMAITPRSGACHRISIVYVGIDNLHEFIQSNYQELVWVKSFCEKCGKCIRKCPTQAILDQPAIRGGTNPTKIIYENCCEGFTKYGCGVCIKECPFTTIGYEKIKGNFENKTTK